MKTYTITINRPNPLKNNYKNRGEDNERVSKTRAGQRYPTSGID
jgi:hypothetical protein